METKTQAPNPEETARVLQEVADRSARILGDFASKNMAGGASAAMSDELGIAKAYMDLYARMLANPLALAATSTSMMMDYMHLWQSSWLKLLGATTAPVAEP